eukprot:gnl/Hemi2/22649_TR7558_c0_g1_i2.p1 gnl/Hemi2/22649_TR7558_c0_g1~~gnl/Hemi2/22649_TR7558_c0_g1_i2.p1  ORF type:complete len:387 (+),score=183.47 gnl/Hemi2/22649_TR7558_c0_g1_i2:159-1319(+)
MKKFGLNTQRGDVASSPAEAEKVAASLKCNEIVVKAQIHAGGRGKGHFNTGFKGGVKLCATPKEAGELAGKMIGNKLITNQTSAEGQPCHKVLVLQSADIYKEMYLAVVLDRAHYGPVIVASEKGGMDIEQVAHEDPNAVHFQPINISVGLTQADAQNIARKLTASKPVDAATLDEITNQVTRLYKLFIETDATQVEINPFAFTNQGVLNVDAKINFDDNAAFRQKEIFAMRDTSQEDPRDVAAAKYDLNYIGLDGNIGCLVNGAGLAMATMDIIKLEGGNPANFLDVGGNASEKQVTEAFKILTSDSQVKAILVNIFGGIMKCDIIAQGIIAACRAVNLQVPLVVRLAGTNSEIGSKLLNESGLAITAAADLGDAAKKAVASLKK